MTEEQRGQISDRLMFMAWAIEDAENPMPPEQPLTWAEQAADLMRADDANWDESKHPRAADGKFGSGGGSAKKSEALKPDPAQYTSPSGKTYSAGKLKQIAQALKAHDPAAALAKLVSLDSKMKKYVAALQDELAVPKPVVPNGSDNSSINDFLDNEKAAEAEMAALEAEEIAKVKPKSKSASPETIKDFKALDQSLKSTKELLKLWQDIDAGKSDPDYFNDVPQGIYGPEHDFVLQALKEDYGVLEQENEDMGMDAKAAKATPPAPPPPVEPSKQSQDLKNGIVANMANVKSHLKQAATDKFIEIETMLSMVKQNPSLMSQMSAVQRIPNPNGMMQTKINEYLASVKKDYGIAPTEPASGPGPSPAAQAAAAKKIAAAPPKYIHHKSKLVDSKGNKVTAVLEADSDTIVGNHYAEVTAAVGNNLTHGAHLTSSAVDNAMHKYQKDVWGKIPEDTHDAIYAYQDSAYKAINGHYNYGTELSGGTKAKDNKLRKAIDHSHCPADMPVFRGLKCNLQDLCGFDDPAKAIGHCFEHKSYASVSRSQQTSRNFSGGATLLKFTVPAGAKALVMGGQDGGEREMILPPNSMFRIDKVEVNTENQKHVVHCTYLGEKSNG